MDENPRRHEQVLWLPELCSKLETTKKLKENIIKFELNMKWYVVTKIVPLFVRSMVQD